jgi:hypothetical protein
VSGRDHETDHDGECFPNCRECKAKNLELEVAFLKGCLQSSRKYNTILEKMLDDHKIPIILSCGKTGDGGGINGR